MPRLTRRNAMGVGAGAFASAALGAQTSAARPDVIVIGAGVFGAWTAAKLQEKGRRVLLLDAWGPAHARASAPATNADTDYAASPSPR